MLQRAKVHMFFFYSASLLTFYPLFTFFHSSELIRAVGFKIALFLLTVVLGLSFYGRGIALIFLSDGQESEESDAPEQQAIQKLTNFTLVMFLLSVVTVSAIVVSATFIYSLGMHLLLTGMGYTLYKYYWMYSYLEEYGVTFEDVEKELEELEESLKKRP